MRRRRYGENAGFAGIFRRAYFRMRHVKAVAAIEGDRGGMIQVTGIEGDPAYVRPPSQVENGFHHIAAETAADGVSGATVPCTARVMEELETAQHRSP